MPEEKSAPATGVQDIIKFTYRYRYLSADGAANAVDQFTFTDGSGTSQGAFSNYVVVDSILRPRVKNTITGLYEWVVIDDDNADSVNINQLDIPIRKGEQVEIQVKSISEAGWPSNPLESEYSTAVRIEFPADLGSDDVVDTILAQNQEDLALVSLNENLEAIGLPTHLSSSFTANETYYAHSSPVIASGFLSENQTPIDLFTKLNEMQNQLDLFAEILNSTQGELNTTLVDDTGNTYKLRRNATTNIFAGFYSQEVRDLDDPRGAIISKTYFINIANSSQTALQLIARISGSRTRMVKQSENPTYSNADVVSGATILPATYSWLDNSAINQTNTRATFRADDVDYNTIRKYDLSPILLTNPTVTAATRYGQTISLPPFQSTQNKNQFIYSRFSDVSDDNNFYSYINPSNDFTFNLDSTENFYNATLASAVSTPVTEFIWGGGFLLAAPNEPTTEATYPTNDDVVQVSIAHPWLSSYTAYRKEYIGLTGDITTLPAVPTLAEHVDMTSGGNGTAAVMFRQSRFAPLKTDEAYGQLQAIYLNENVVDLTLLAAAMPTTFNSGQTLQASPSLTGVGTTTSVSPLAGVNYSRNAKTSFEGFDQYALGQQSCGSYLFVSSDNHQNIQVDGDAIQSYEVIGFGQQNSINIPLVFQYRMTDYFGVTSGSGLGNIAGDSTGNTVNLTYAKKIGFDLYPNNSDVVQFDIEISANYRSDRLSIKQFPKATVTKGLNDLEKVVRGLRPSLNQAAISANASGGSVTSDFSGIQA